MLNDKHGLVLSLGSINADFQVRVSRRPHISETLVSTEFQRFSGGKAANVAYLVHRLGLNARLFGRVGDDDLAEQALRPLRDIGVELSEVKQVTGASTGVAMITVPPDGNKGIVLAPNANEAWSDDEAAEIAGIIDAMPAEAVLVIDCEISGHVLEAAVSAASYRGQTIILDPSPADRVTNTVLAAADVVAPNASEAEQLTGVKYDDVNTAAQAGALLLKRGAAAACMKLAEGGCVLVEERHVTYIGSVPVDVVDTTGAGDAFVGALAVALVEQHLLVDAVAFAAAASHLTVTGYGSQAALPTREQIQHLAKRLDVRKDVIFTP